MKLPTTIFLLLTAAIQAAVWIFPRSTFASVINHIAVYGWCSIIILLAAAIPGAGLLGLFLHVREFLEPKVKSK